MTNRLNLSKNHQLDEEHLALYKEIYLFYV
jgi:hypothetical protein